jgi:hypothetical protein
MAYVHWLCREYLFIHVVFAGDRQVILQNGAYAAFDCAPVSLFAKERAAVSYPTALLRFLPCYRPRECERNEQND